MGNGLQPCTEQHRLDAAAELAAELEEFSFDGLVQLAEDLAKGDVIRGSWSGCVISYRRGAAGSTRRDRSGRTRNAFTVLWDNGWMTDEEVALAVDREVRRRRNRAGPAPAGSSPVSATRAGGRIQSSQCTSTHRLEKRPDPLWPLLGS